MGSIPTGPTTKAQVERLARRTAAIAGPFLWSTLTDAAHRGVVPREAARLVWLHAAGHSVAAVTTQTGTGLARAYRLRGRGYAHLRDELDVAS